MRVISINIGKVTAIEFKGKSITTSIFKKPVSGTIRVGRLNLEGDEQADLRAHGGEHRAVMVYQKESYDYWQQVLGKKELPFGSFGENLTVEGLADAEVCIGDQYAIGTAIFEVTQPRVTCYKVGISLNVPEMPALLVRHKRPGFYFRVIREGAITAGDQITKVKDGPGQMSIVEIDALLYSGKHPQERLQQALDIPALSKGWKHSFEELYSSIVSGHTSSNAGLAPPAAAALAWEGFRQVIVQAVTVESEGVRSFILSAPDRTPLPAFTAGQHIAVRVPSNGTASFIRMYSLCGPIAGGTYRIAVKQEKEGRVSGLLHASVKAGDILEIGAPRGTFTLVNESRPLVLLSAGIGLTPLLAMLCAAAKEQPQRSIWWIHSTKNKVYHSFAHEISEVTKSLSAFHCEAIYSSPGATDQRGIDYNQTGHLDLALLETMQLPKDGDYYLCGPSGYMSDVTQALKQFGIPDDRVRFEAFGNFQPANQNGPLPHIPTGEPGDGPEITFVKTNLSFNWSPRFGHLLEAIEACDLPVSWSCRSGVCHRCETRLLSGEVRYDPQPLDAPTNGNIFICCAIPVTPVQLDL